MPVSPSADLASQIDALLPQTQCTRCGYPACRPYAEAIAGGEAPINRCPPGGDAGIAALAHLLDQPVRPLDPDYGELGPRLLATIEPAQCIGCTKCILACPVDAIIGGPKLMHTVLPSLCSGCELCVPPCPVDCIRIDPVSTPWTGDDASAARIRFEQREARRQNRDPAGGANQAPDAHAGAPSPGANKSTDESAADQKQRLVAAAMSRARARRQQRGQRS